MESKVKFALWFISTNPYQLANLSFNCAHFLRWYHSVSGWAGFQSTVLCAHNCTSLYSLLTFWKRRLIGENQQHVGKSAGQELVCIKGGPCLKVEQAVRWLWLEGVVVPVGNVLWCSVFPCSWWGRILCRSESNCDNFLWFLSCGVTLELRSTSPDLQRVYSGGTRLNDSGSSSNSVSQANKIWFKCKLASVGERGRKG